MEAVQSFDLSTLKSNDFGNVSCHSIYSNAPQNKLLSRLKIHFLTHLNSEMTWNSCWASVISNALCCFMKILLIITWILSFLVDETVNFVIAGSDCRSFGGKFWR